MLNRFAAIGISAIYCKSVIPILADRTSGRAYATVLRPSVGCNVCIAKTVHPRAKVTTDSLYELVCEESISNKMNDLDLCLEVV